jgi:cyclic pyranopterin phosphate synthase
VSMGVVNTGPSDQLGRPVRDLRLSVTDRCNFRCPYCMPRDAFGPGHAFLARDEILTYEEFARLVAVFAELGVSKVRLTGGEPLLRKDLETLISMVASTPGITDVALTTNGSLLCARAASLRAAGLDRVTVSLDSIDPAMFAAMADTRLSLSTVLDGIQAATEAGLAPVKLNAVVRRGRNDDGIVELADFARTHGHVLRFIEYMDVGDTNKWVLDDVVPSAEVIARIGAVFPVEPLPPTRRSEVAKRWRYVDGAGEIGVISSVTQPFCTDCTRARVTSTGELFNSLFGEKEPRTLSCARSSLLCGREGATAIPKSCAAAQAVSHAPRCRTSAASHPRYCVLNGGPSGTGSPEAIRSGIRAPSTRCAPPEPISIGPGPGLSELPPPGAPSTRPSPTPSTSGICSIRESWASSSPGSVCTPSTELPSSALAIAASIFGPPRVSSGEPRVSLLAGAGPLPDMGPPTVWRAPDVLC